MKIKYLLTFFLFQTQLSLHSVAYAEEGSRLKLPSLVAPKPKSESLHPNTQPQATSHVSTKNYAATEVSSVSDRPLIFRPPVVGQNISLNPPYITVTENGYETEYINTRYCEGMDRRPIPECELVQNAKGHFASVSVSGEPLQSVSGAEPFDQLVNALSREKCSMSPLSTCYIKENIASATSYCPEYKVYALKLNGLTVGGYHEQHTCSWSDGPSTYGVADAKSQVEHQLKILKKVSGCK